MKKSEERSGVISGRLLACIGALCLVTTILLYADPPGWWASRGVTSGTTLSGTDDYAVVNQGQLKNMATAAFAELQAHLPSGVGVISGTSAALPQGSTGYQLTNLINSWSQSGTETPGANTNDYAAVNIGQVKHVARLFYKRLIEAGFASSYPWDASGNAPNDYAAANIGQVKNLFGFDLTTGTATDGVPDMWEMNWFGTTGLSGTSLAPSGALDANGAPMTLQECYQQGVSPIDYYNGAPPTLTITGGNGQTGPLGAFLSGSLVVLVTGTSGPLMNAPVAFSVTLGTGLLAPDGSGTSPTNTSIQAVTGTDGKAYVFFQQPADFSFTSTISAFAEGNHVDFSESTNDDPTNPPIAPSNVAAYLNDDGSVSVTWQDNSNNETGFIIQRSDDGGQTWVTVGTVGPNITSFLVPASSAGTPGSSQFQALATNNNGQAASSGTTNGTSTPFIPLPVVNYSPIDVSGTWTTTSTGTADVVRMALGDTNQVSYCYASGTDSSGTHAFTVNTWTSGTTTANTITGTAQPITTQVNPNIGQPMSGTMTSSFSVPFLTPEGAAYITDSQRIDISYTGAGQLEEDIFYLTNPYYYSPGSGQPQDYSFTSGSLTSSGSLASCYFATSGTDLVVYPSTLNYPPFQMWSLGGVSVGGCSEAGYFVSGTVVCPSSFQMNGDTIGAYFNGSFICITSGTIPAVSTGTTVFYDPTSGSNGALQGYIPSGTTTGTTASGSAVGPSPGSMRAIPVAFSPTAMNDNGAAIGTGDDGAYFWDGTNLNSLGATTALNGINNQKMLVGYTGNPDSDIGMLWLGSSGTAYAIQDLLPSAYQNEVHNILPIAISNANGSTHRVSILCSAMVQELASNPGGIAENIVLQVDKDDPANSANNSAKAPTVSILHIPNYVHPEYLHGIQSINQNGVIAAIRWLTTTNPDGTKSNSKQKAFLYIPVEFEAEDRFSEGFDPPMRFDMDQNGAFDEDDWVAWTSVVKSGSLNTNKRVKLVFPTDDLASQYELAVQNDSTGWITLPSGTSPQLLTTASTDLTITGSAGDQVPDKATILVQTKDASHQILCKLYVEVFPELKPLNLKFYIVRNSTNLLSDGFFVPASGTVSGTWVADPTNQPNFDAPAQIVAEINSRFAAAGVQVKPGNTDYISLIVHYDEKNDHEFDFDPDESVFTSGVYSGNFNGDRNLVVVKDIPGDGGIAGLGHKCLFINGDLTLFGSPGQEDESDGCWQRMKRIAAHEFGHTLNLSTRNSIAWGRHDSGPFPLGTVALMHQGSKTEDDPLIGRWMRHEDWIQANQTAAGINP